MQEINLDRLVKRFVDYVSIDTTSDDTAKTSPSSRGQVIFGEHLERELQAIGLQDVERDENGYLMATLPANTSEEVPTIGFIAHLDTSADAAGGPVKPTIIQEYDGKDIVLNKEKNIVLRTKDFPEIKHYINEPIMVTDGTTLLGADDKAGVCAIVSAMEYLVNHPEIKHGKLRIAFTPDEEIGRSADLFDVAKFGADFAYTIDGGEVGALEYENFNAANANIYFHGRSVHTGSAKGKMVNAISLATEWQQMLPKGEVPECTEKYEGFFHVHRLKGGVEEAEMFMLIRDHDKKHFEKRKQLLSDMAEFMNKKYGAGTVVVDIEDSYYNMGEKIAPVMYIIEAAMQAMEKAGIKPICEPIRGGTDGARLSFMGLPCPNIFAGGLNFHGVYEYLPLLSLQKAVETIVGITTEVANGKRKY